MSDKYEHLAPAPPSGARTRMWGTPEPGTFLEYSWKTLLPNNEILIHRLEQDSRDRLLGFALIHMADGENGDNPVVEVDTRHGEVHIHQYRSGNVRIGRRVIRIIASQRDVEEGYDEALEVITENWEEHKRRWQRGQ